MTSNVRRSKLPVFTSSMQHTLEAPFALSQNYIADLFGSPGADWLAFALLQLFSLLPAVWAAQCHAAPSNGGSLK
jgi:hypothetical protein